MNHSCEMWSRPWHALQKDLAEGINVPGTANAGRIAEAQSIVKVRGFTVSANSWLSRIQLRTPAAPARQ